MSDAGATFEPQRAHLLAVAYRMLGSYAEAEDVVQDAFLRWHASDREDIVDTRAFLVRVVSRIALDRLGSARARREQYVGAWLPEPVMSEQVASPEAATEYAQDLSMALLMTLERLSPLERAAFLLHDVFDVGFDDIAATLGKSEAAIRQLASRARTHVHAEAPRFTPAPETTKRLMERFEKAMISGDVGGLSELLAEDVVLHTDGGGKRLATMRPIIGRDKVVRFFEGVRHKHAPVDEDTVRRVTLNGMPGFLVREGELLETVALQIVGEQVVALYSVRNPDKLGHLRWPGK